MDGLPLTAPGGEAGGYAAAPLLSATLTRFGRNRRAGRSFVSGV